MSVLPAIGAATRAARACVLLTLSVCGCLSGCAEQLTPIQVAEKFWTAVEQRDADEVRKFVTKEDAVDLERHEDVLPISEIALGRTIIDAETAVIDTTVTVSADKPVSVPLKTRLLLEDGRWKVDYDATVVTISSGSQLARAMQQIRDFGTALQDGIDKSVDELERALPEIEREIRRLEDQVKQKIPELRQRMEEFAKKLEEAFREPQREDTDEPEAPIAI